MSRVYDNASLGKAAFEREFGAFLVAAGVYNFSPRELCDVGRVVERGDETAALLAPPRNLWQNILPTVRRAEIVRARLRDKYPGAVLIVNSGYRDWKYNLLTGGVSRSMHLDFNALDLRAVIPDRLSGRPKNVMPVEVRDLIVGLPDSGRFYTQLYSTFVHFDTRHYVADLTERWHG